MHRTININLCYPVSRGPVYWKTPVVCIYDQVLMSQIFQLVKGFSICLFIIYRLMSKTYPEIKKYAKMGELWVLVSYRHLSLIKAFFGYQIWDLRRKTLVQTVRSPFDHFEVIRWMISAYLYAYVVVENTRKTMLTRKKDDISQRIAINGLLSVIFGIAYTKCHFSAMKAYWADGPQSKANINFLGQPANYVGNIPRLYSKAYCLPNKIFEVKASCRIGCCAQKSLVIGLAESKPMYHVSFRYSLHHWKYNVKDISCT